MAEFTIKRNDTTPPFEYQLVGDDGNAVDLTGASVRFLMRPTDAPKGELLIDASAAIENATEGRVSYDWANDGSDTDTAGRYETEWEVTHSGGSIQTFPRDDYLDVEIVPDLG